MLTVYEDCVLTECHTGEENNIPLEMSRMQRFVFLFRRFFIASHTNRSARRHLRSKASIDFEKRRQYNDHIFTIHPFSIFRHWWDVIMIVVIFVGISAIPFQAAFDMRPIESWTWIFVKNSMLVICMFDILINFMTGYFDKPQCVVELNLHKIAVHYAKNRLIFDLLGSFPTDLFFIPTWYHYIVLRRTVSLTFIFRSAALFRYMNKIGKDYEVRRALYDFFNTILWIVAFWHWQACLYWLIPVVVTSRTALTEPGSDSWMSKVEGLWNDSNFNERYEHSMLRGIATFMHSGFLVRTEPETKEDQYLVIIFHMLSTKIFCYLIAQCMQFFKGVNSSKLKYQAAMAHLTQYMSHKKLPHKTQDRIALYYEFRFQKRFFREPEILGILSMHMRQEIRMHSCRKLVENVTFFNNLPLSLLSRIVALLKSEIFLTNDLIVKANQKGNCMYFIASGTVAVYTLTGKEVCHLEDGAHFGEIALVMPDAKRVASVVAIETCTLYKLKRADFARTIHPYPMLWERIKKIAIDRHEKTTIMNAK